MSERKYLSGTSLSGMSPTRNRVENDFYATHPNSTKAILDNVTLDGSILEPATGQGHISEVLKEYYPNSEVVSTDLIDRGYGVGGIDFLTHDYDRKFSNVITNPPFKYAKEFIEKALEISTDKVLMFCKVQLLEGVARQPMFLNSPLKYVYVFSKRQAILSNGSEYDEKGKKWASTMCFAWFVWEHGYEGEPVIRWL